MRGVGMVEPLYKEVLGYSHDLGMGKYLPSVGDSSRRKVCSRCTITRETYTEGLDELAGCEICYPWELVENWLKLRCLSHLN